MARDAPKICEIVVVYFVAKGSLPNLIQPLELIECYGESIGHDEPMKEDGEALLAKRLHLFRFAQNLCSGWNQNVLAIVRVNIICHEAIYGT